MHDPTHDGNWVIREDAPHQLSIQDDDMGNGIATGSTTLGALGEGQILGHVLVILVRILADQAIVHGGPMKCIEAGCCC